METWANSHDALKDISIPDQMTKDEMYDAEFAKIWKMGWEHFLEHWEILMNDAEKNAKAMMMMMMMMMMTTTTTTFLMKSIWISLEK